MPTHQHNESLRLAAREVLASRPGVALPLPGIRRRIEQATLVDHKFTEEELRAALAVLIGLKQIEVTYDQLGSTEHFQATSEGILAFERGQ